MADQVNLYTYVGNNPIRFSDPSGENSKPILTLQAFGWFFTETFWVETVNAPWPSDVNTPNVEPNYGTWWETTIFVAGFVVPGWKASEGGKVLYDANKINHIFSNSEHLLEALIQKYWSQETAMEALQNAVTQAAKDFTIVSGNLFKNEIVNIDGIAITVRGAIVDGVARIGTAFVWK